MKITSLININLKTLFILVYLAINCYFVTADIYMHNPRGSNNRLDEQSRERANDNRLFDSQNNDRGGYNVGNMYYTVDSILPIEFTNQHSCKTQYSNCDIIIQYMCSESIRDGSDVRSIPDNNANCANNNCNSDYQFGMHEDYDYYQSCRKRMRNKGLFVADQRLRDQTAIYTRQNPNGERFGYECPEERDYYPYWSPTKWIDVAILTDNVKKCDYFKAESENVKSRWFCSVPSTNNQIVPINKEDCEKIDQAKWVESPAHKVDPPICREAQATRDNHLGNTKGGNPPNFNWKIPDTQNNSCVLRIRYNISTNDYDRWQTFQLQPNQPTDVNLNLKLGLSSDEAKKRGFILKNNPSVKIFSDLNFTLNLAINTAQYGRVFEDRSHSFGIRKINLDNTKRVFNLNVRGKRGNIVQVYPSVEYDYIPNRLELSKNDIVHIQWTGSNKNPPNNDGQGVAGTDRSNIVLMKYRDFNKGQISNPFSPIDLYGDFGVNYPLNLENNTYAGLSRDDLAKTAFLGKTGGSMQLLDDASTYFDLGPIKITSSGVVHYMCTRNNNFSNRDQKGELIIYENQFVEDFIGLMGGTLKLPENGEIKIGEGSLNDLTHIRIDIKPRSQIMKESEVTSSQNAYDLMKDLTDSSISTDFYIIRKLENDINVPFNIKLNLKDSLGAYESVSVYKISSDYSTMTKLTTNLENNQVSFETQQAGIYFAKKESNYSVLIAVLVSVFILLTVIGAIVFYLFRNPKYVQLMRHNACNIKRSMQNEL